MTFKSFIARCFVLAELIRQKTDKNEKRTGILLPNAVGTAVTFFAVLALGRVAAMLNFTMGAAQVRGACARADVKTVVTSKEFVETAKLESTVEALKAANVRVLYLEDLIKSVGLIDKIYGLAAKWIPELFLALIDKTKPDDPAVILFTSGSEGAPKGVVLSHKNFMANRYQLASRIDFGPQDVVFNCLPMFHAFGLLGGMLLPMLSGIKVFFYPSPLHYRVVPELIYDSNATILFGTDTFLTGYARFANPYDFYALRYVFAGAEKLKDETQRVWFEKFGIRIFEGYGATETAPVLCVNTAMHHRAGTVGRFLPGIETRLEPVPGIHEGQRLFVKGPNVMLGYMKDDKPGVLQPLADGWYDTGDIVSVDGEGYVSILGRVKRFAKVGGEMVSLAAVEDVINALWPGYLHAVVSVPDEKKGEALVLMTDKQDAKLDDLLDAFHRRGLPELALPRRLIKLEALPLLGTGKVDYVQARQIALKSEET